MLENFRTIFHLWVILFAVVTIFPEYEMAHAQSGPISPNIQERTEGAIGTMGEGDVRRDAGIAERLRARRGGKKSQLGTAIVKVKPLESKDDGYWPWFIDYFTKRSAQRYLVNENRVKLSMLAKQANSKRSRWFKLLIEDLRYTEADLDATRGSGSSSIPFLESQIGTDFFDQLINGRNAEHIAGIQSDLKAQREVLRTEIKSIHD